MTTLEEIQLVPPGETCRLLAVSRRQLDNLVAVGVLTPVRLRPGGNRRFRLRELERLVERGATDNDETEDER